MKTKTYIFLLTSLLLLNLIKINSKSGENDFVSRAFILGEFLIGIRGIENRDLSIFDALPNYPNPFNPVTNINYQLPVESSVNLTVYDVSGRAVTELVNKIQDRGIYTATWNAESFASGVYFYRFTATGVNNNSLVYSKTVKMILVK